VAFGGLCLILTSTEHQMTTFPNSPRLLKGGIVLIDADTSKVLRIITLQYNSDTLTRTLAPKGIKESGERSKTLRLTRSTVEVGNNRLRPDAINEIPRRNRGVIQSTFGRRKLERRKDE
jgi:hypothetical protein